MEDDKKEMVKTLTEEELIALKRRKPGRKSKPLAEKKNRPKTLKEDGTWSRQQLTTKRKQALEKARVTRMENLKRRKEEALKHDKPVASHTPIDTNTKHLEKEIGHHNAPSYLPMEVPKRENVMYF